MAEQTRLTPEMLVPRIGEYLIKQGKITEEDLEKALTYQREQVSGGNSRLLGETLVELGLIDRSDLDATVTEQILQLRGALQAANRNLERRVKERTAELQEALHRLNELAQLKANFISNISHELRTPLTHMKGYIELMIAQSLGPLTEEQEHALQVSQRSTVRLESLIDDLIMFSMASRGELTIKQEPTDIKNLADICVKSALQKAEARGVSVNVVAGKELPLVHVDPQKMSWVISQLLDNGIKFTPAGGSVVVNIEQDSETLLLVSITDTGIGIPNERLKEIFEPFHQLDGSSTRRYGGTGLGLSLIREIIEAHGSIIDVQSVEGHGTTMKFPLLIAAPESKD